MPRKIAKKPHPLQGITLRNVVRWRECKICVDFYNYLKGPIPHLQSGCIEKEILEHLDHVAESHEVTYDLDKPQPSYLY